LFSSSVTFISTPKGGKPCLPWTSSRASPVSVSYCGFRVQSVPSGDISVMPQACTTCTS
jgi:hypothetical protein